MYEDGLTGRKEIRDRFNDRFSEIVGGLFVLLEVSRSSSIVGTPALELIKIRASSTVVSVKPYKSRIWTSICDCSQPVLLALLFLLAIELNPLLTVLRWTVYESLATAHLIPTYSFFYNLERPIELEIEKN